MRKSSFKKLPPLKKKHAMVVSDEVQSKSNPKYQPLGMKKNENLNENSDEPKKNENHGNLRGTPPMPRLPPRNKAQIAGLIFWGVIVALGGSRNTIYLHLFWVTLWTFVACKLRNTKFYSLFTLKGRAFSYLRFQN